MNYSLISFGFSLAFSSSFFSSSSFACLIAFDSICAIRTLRIKGFFRILDFQRPFIKSFISFLLCRAPEWLRSFPKMIHSQILQPYRTAPTPLLWRAVQHYQLVQPLPLRSSFRSFSHSPQSDFQDCPVLVYCSTQHFGGCRAVVAHKFRCFLYRSTHFLQSFRAFCQFRLSCDNNNLYPSTATPASVPKAFALLRV